MSSHPSIVARRLRQAVPLKPAGRPPGRFVRVAGRAVHVVEDGPATGPAVVLGAGLGGAWLGWEALVRALDERCRVIRVDRPGLGRSEPSPDAPTLAGQAAWLASVLDVLGTDGPGGTDGPNGPGSPVGPVVLVGHSLSGLYAEAFARLLPERTAAVVLVEAAAEKEVGAPLRWPRARVRAAKGAGEVFRWTGLSQLVAPAIRRQGVRTQSLRGRDPDDVGDAYRCAYGAGHCLKAALVERVLFRDLNAELLALRREREFPEVPLQVISGPLSDPRPHRALASMSPLGRYRLAPGTRHLVPVDRPDTIADAIAEVLLSAGRGTPAAVRTTPRT
ncbi:alpha/beta hydrolase [Streptomyces sp. H10-C2]|uniref:alpha/beta fold hydrolase n=1 Tax=unclassified Streptomyces TaxID=2593676 RepID=UPI0024B8BE23|nr:MULTISPECIES: alpha/beta hydrolase [unclassified Streptomyces]MDJ0340891.1 alpha/beta hydrolase [Streptomyces sp. PH10-H1]MDJ0369878.1 alpha/beta hydrolase [Streptomyces sp. H10-C2]